MKANRLAKDEGGDFGIGTMIIFIAMIIVAVVAATVLVTTVNKLQSQAEATSNEALQQMSAGVNLKNVIGSRMTAGFTIPGLNLDVPGSGGEVSSFVQQLDLLVELRAGSLPINLDRTIVRVVTERDVINYAGETIGDEDARPFVEIRPVRDTDESIANDHALNKMGDIAAITIDISDLGIGPGDSFDIHIIPDVGGIPTTTGVRMPLSYPHDAQQIQLYP